MTEEQKQTIEPYSKIAKDCRLKVLELIYKAQTSHIGSCFSAIDIMTVLLSDFNWDRDVFVLSAGWKAAPLYYFLWKAGRITEEELNSYCQEGSKFIGLAEPIIPEIKFAGGSMGMGFPAAVGFALAKKLNGEEGTIYCLMSDGELAIGTTWEAALIAAHHNLDNLIVVVDVNGWQAMGKTDNILHILPSKAFPSWIDLNVNGHNYKQIEYALKYISKDSFWKTKPKVIIADTTKGKGVSFMENNNLYHYKQLSEQEYGRANQELRQA